MKFIKKRLVWIAGGIFQYIGEIHWYLNSPVGYGASLRHLPRQRKYRHSGTYVIVLRYSSYFRSSTYLGIWLLLVDIYEQFLYIDDFSNSDQKYEPRQNGLIRTREFDRFNQVEFGDVRMHFLMQEIYHNIMKICKQ